MKVVRVFEGPLCCNTGVCGPDVDQQLVDFTADAHWASSHGAEVVRANVAQDPQAFSQHPVAMQFVQAAGLEGLPLVLVDEVTVLTGRYPTRVELARFAGLEAAGATMLPTVQSGSCCGADPGTQAPAASGCCGGR